MALFFLSGGGGAQGARRGGLNFSAPVGLNVSEGKILI